MRRSSRRCFRDLGELDFGRGVTAESNIAIWRERGTHRPMCGEFAFEAKFKRADELAREGDGSWSAVLHCAAAVRARLALPGHDQGPGSFTGSKATRPRPMSD